MTTPTPTPTDSPFQTPLTPYPARTLTSTATIANTPTVCTRIDFADRILLTISQEGRLAYWLQTPLITPTPDPDPSFSSSLLPSSNTDNDDSNNSNNLLPPTHLTPTSLLGTPPAYLSTFAQTLCAKTGGLILEAAAAQSNKTEHRPLILGVGFAGAMLKELQQSQTSSGQSNSSRLFGELVGLVLGVL
ncbi:hypothetical protein EJ05DRAFT_540275 [Pseudovirgaria hyperparasitica]|uniref:Proteasome assembly chaperone 3 n=1 Tax=Pseudovirgaria hyperparasitica TaxID=470096 RepID=A0A6A6W1X5_9PEZI|nr:uncharacterized protein EJ05DRAFT_540275 [Pseudovirgaria hyperparasitica]KAF2755577.1 hypothetical protein EJ05DRAFT_540275 [Pseudovirgaria hyperparasitica]